MGLPVFLADFGGALPAAGVRLRLDGDEGRHAVAVRRIGVGDELLLTDGADRRARVRVAAVEGKSALTAEVISAEDVPRPAPHVTVVQALPKSDRAELAVDLAVEVGADRIVPWAARRCVARWTDAKEAKARAKWAATAREAAKQARRTWVPPVGPLHDHAALLGLVLSTVAGGGRAAVLHEAGGRPLRDFAESLGDAGEVLLVVGPEGGLDDAELADLRDAGAEAVILGPTVLRTALAGAAAISALGPLTGRW